MTVLSFSSCKKTEGEDKAGPRPPKKTALLLQAVCLAEKFEKSGKTRRWGTNTTAGRNFFVLGGFQIDIVYQTIHGRLSRTSRGLSGYKRKDDLCDTRRVQQRNFVLSLTSSFVLLCRFSQPGIDRIVKGVQPFAQFPAGRHVGRMSFYVRNHVRATDLLAR